MGSWSPSRTDPALGARLAAALEPELDVVLAYVFGSAARGDARPLSDVDVAVLLDSAAKPGHRRLELDRIVAEAIGHDGVDVVILNSAPPKLAYRVVRDGMVLVSRDERRRLRWEVSAIDRYLDLQPFYAAQDAALSERIRTGRFGRSPGRS